MIVRREITIMLLLASVLLIGSCAEKKTPPVMATPALTSAEKTTTSIQAVEGDIKTMTSHINSTNASLNQVIQLKGAPDAKTAFDAYSRNVSQMDKAAAAFLRDSDQMTARGIDYFAEWSKSGDTYTNPQIRQLSEERRSQLMNTFNQIAGPSGAVKVKVSTYLSQVKQIQTYLSNDLSATGIDAISPIALKTINDGQQIIMDAQPMLAAAEQARTEIGEIGAATGGVSSPGK